MSPQRLQTAPDISRRETQEEYEKRNEKTTKRQKQKGNSTRLKEKRNQHSNHCRNSKLVAGEILKRFQVQQVILCKKIGL